MEKTSPAEFLLPLACSSGWGEEFGAPCAEFGDGTFFGSQLLESHHSQWCGDSEQVPFPKHRCTTCHLLDVLMEGRRSVFVCGRERGVLGPSVPEKAKVSASLFALRSRALQGCF